MADLGAPARSRMDGWTDGRSGDESQPCIRPSVHPPVLCYHRIGGPRELGVTRISARTFRRQMESLARAGWQTLTLDQYAESVHAGLTPGRRPGVSRASTFLLSFDDAYASLAEHAFPV